MQKRKKKQRRSKKLKPGDKCLFAVAGLSALLLAVNAVGELTKGLQQAAEDVTEKVKNGQTVKDIEMFAENAKDLGERFNILAEEYKNAEILDSEGEIPLLSEDEIKALNEREKQSEQSDEAAVPQSGEISDFLSEGSLVLRTEGGEKRIKLIGITIPERTELSDGTKVVDAIRKSLKKGSSVSLKYDVEKTDKFDRLLAYVYLDSGEMLQELLLSEGYADVEASQEDKYKEFTKLRDEAKANRKGIWNAGSE